MGSSIKGQERATMEQRMSVGNLFAPNILQCSQVTSAYYLTYEFNFSTLQDVSDLLRHPVQSKTVFVMVPDTVLQPDPSARHLQIFDTRKHILNDKCENKLFQI